MISLQTRIARAEAQQAEVAWGQHRQHCAACDIAAGKRRYAGLCPEGARARQLSADLHAEARHQARLDRLPDPNQGALFDLGDLP
jgi:hypothetical protein